MFFRSPGGIKTFGFTFVVELENLWTIGDTDSAADTIFLIDPRLLHEFMPPFDYMLKNVYQP
jgi:hypothetical protein